MSNTQQVALRDPAWQAEWAQMIEVARAVSNTGYVPDTYRGKPDDVFATIIAGKALGLQPIVALMNCAVISGRPTFEGEVLLGLIRRHGHSVRRTECSPERVVVVGKRADNGDEQEVVWTSERVERAGLAGKQSHKTYPEIMLTWRAITELARILFPDVTLGLASYTAEELGADDPEAMGRIIVDTDTGEIHEPDGTLEATDPQGRTLRMDTQGFVNVETPQPSDVAEDAEWTPADHDAGGDGTPAPSEPDPQAEPEPDDEPDFDARPPFDRLEAALDDAGARGLKGWTRTAVLARAKKSWPGVTALADLDDAQVTRIIDRLNEKLREAGLEEAA